jgi:hypothetical protein
MQRPILPSWCRFGGSILCLFLLAAALSIPSTASSEMRAKIRASGKKTTDGPPFAFLCLDSNRVPDVDQIERALVKWMKADASRPITDLVVCQEIGEPIAISFHYDGRAFAAGVVDRPIPQGDLDYACGNAFFWPDASSVLNQHTSHLIVTALGDYDQPWQRALRLSEMMAACIEAFEGSLGVYWGHASVVHAPEFFLQGMREAGDQAETVPVELWTGFLRTERDDQTADMYTDGLDVFGCREFEIVASGQSLEDMFEMLIGMSRYVIYHGNVIGDGDTIGGTAEKKILTHFGPSAIGRPAQVILVDY